jgi:hypothetical protein
MVVAAGPQPVEVRVATIQPVPSPRQAGDPLFAVILEEVDGTRRLPVVMRKPEADAVQAHLKNVPTADL